MSFDKEEAAEAPRNYFSGDQGWRPEVSSLQVLEANDEER